MRKRLHLKAEKGWLRAYVLYIGDRPCAFWVGTLYCQEFHSDFMGYDPDYSKYSPGMYLINQVIESFCNSNEEIAAIDFGLGDAQYKEILGDVQWQDACAYVFAPTLRGLALNAMRTPIMAIDRAGRQALGRVKLLSKLKKLWRRRAALTGQPPLRRQKGPTARPPNHDEQERVSVNAQQQ
jgi:CelD/BcsL family acetyltransferase involved in cellulose biosynthesis